MTTPFKVIATALFLAPSIALAQSATQQGVGTPAAPVGHRQPTAADVPIDDTAAGASKSPLARHGKTRAGEKPEDFGVPTICVGCGR